MADIVELAAGLWDVGYSSSDVDGALEALRTERRFTVDAAYAYARQREADPGWQRAADLLELAVAERDARAYSRSPWWARLEVLVLGWVLLGVVAGGLRFVLVGPAALRYPGTWIWALYPLAWWYMARRHQDPLRALSRGLGRIDRAVDKTLRTGHAIAHEDADHDRLVAAMRRAAGGHSEDPLENRIAGVVLARTQRQVASFPERHRQALLSALDRARCEQIYQALPEAAADRLNRESSSGE